MRATDRGMTACLLVLILLMAMAPLLHGEGVRAKGTDIMDGPSRFGDDTGETSLVLELASNGNPGTLGHLSLPANATVLGAAMTVNPWPGASHRRTGAQDEVSTVHPRSPQVDVGDDGTIDWAFRGTGYGAAGRQTLFGNGQGRVFLGHPEDLTPRSWRNQSSRLLETTVRLPSSARVSTASLLIEPRIDLDWWDTDWMGRIPLTITPHSPLDTPLAVEREIFLPDWAEADGSDVRLTSDGPDGEAPHPFWITDVPGPTVRVGFTVESWTLHGPTVFNVYFGNPEQVGPAAGEAGPGPVRTVFAGDRVPSPRGDAGDRELSRPHGIHVDARGRLLVSDTGNHRILVMGTDGEVVDTLGMKGRPGPGDDRLNCPHDVVTDSRSRIIVADTCNHRVQVFDRDGDHLSTLGRTGDPGHDHSHLFYPWSVAVDRSDRIYVSDMGNNRVVRFDHVGSQRAGWSVGVGTEPGDDARHLSAPRGLIPAPAGGVAVADTMNSRVQLFGTDDGWADSTLRTEEMLAPSDVATEGEEYLVTDELAGKLFRFGPQGALETTMAGLEGPGAVDVGGGSIWISETGAHRLLRLVDAGMKIGPVETNGLPDEYTLLMEGAEMAGISATGPPLALDITPFVENAVHRSDCRPDDFGNDMCDIKLSLEAPWIPAGAGITIKGLDIRYDFGTRMYVALATGTDQYGAGEELPVSASSTNGGRIMLRDISLDTDLPPFPREGASGTLIPPVPEGSGERPLVPLDPLFVDESDLSFRVATADPGLPVYPWVRSDGMLMVDLSTAPELDSPVDLVVRATDVHGQESRAVNLTVDILPVNDPPSVRPLAPMEQACGQGLGISVDAHDPDDADLEYYLVTAPEGMVVEAGGFLNWTPAPGQAGAHEVLVGVTDGREHVYLDTTITVNCPPGAELVPAQGRLDLRVGGLLRLRVLPEGTGGEVALERGPAGMALSDRGDHLLWRPAAGDVGVHTAVLSLTLPSGEVGQRTYRMCVGPRIPRMTVTDGPDWPDGERVIFAGHVANLSGRSLVTEYRLDGGDWRAMGERSLWRVELDGGGLSMGLHRIDFRARDREFDVYSEVVERTFTVHPTEAAGREGNRGSSPDGWTILMMTVIAMVSIGGFAVLKRIDGRLFCVHKSPEGPAFLVPLGEDERAEAGGNGNDGDTGDGDRAPAGTRRYRCFLCLGSIKKEDQRIDCPGCDRSYHLPCARRIVTCPMCSDPLVTEEA